MPKSREQLFDDFVQFVTQHGYGAVYTRDSHQSVPPDCGFLRFRAPGGTIFTSAGTVKFRTREGGVTACNVLYHTRKGHTVGRAVKALNFSAYNSIGYNL